MGTHPIFESDLDCLTEMDVSEDHNLTFTIHPLVLLNISQHFTRVRAQRHREGEKQAPHPVAGALLGKTSTRSIEIRDSFEVPAKCENGRLVSIDSQYLLNKEEHLIESKVTEYEIVGWYSTGRLEPETGEKEISKKILETKDASLFLKLDPFRSQRDTNEMPMTLYEYEPNYILTKRVFSLEAKDAEQIAVEDLAGDGSAGQEFGAAIRLYHRVKILKKYLEDVNSGVLPNDPEITRQANAMLSQLPSSPANQISTSQTDYSLISSLATVTEGSQSLQQLLARFDILHDKPGQKQRIRGLFI